MRRNLPTIIRRRIGNALYAREHAEQWLCDSRKIAVMGFSAGGHAAAHLGTRWHEMGFDPACRPDAMILSYPVITSGEFAHRNSFKCLLAEREEELKDVVSGRTQLFRPAAGGY